MHVSPGQFIALVGLSGSGKTTLANLLPRFVERSAGNISVDGVDVTQWNLAALRSQFAWVGQNVVMFNDTVLHNITLGQAVDRERALAALQAANLAEHRQSGAGLIAHRHAGTHHRRHRPPALHHQRRGLHLCLRAWPHPAAGYARRTDAKRWRLFGIYSAEPELSNALAALENSEALGSIRHCTPA